MSQRNFSFLFFLIVVSDLLVGHFYVSLRWVTKPLILLSLIAFYYWDRRRYLQSEDWVFLMALVAALLGDILLIADDLFIGGLVSFLLMQLLYINIFTSGDNFYGRREYLMGGALILFLFLILSWLWPHLGAMSLPVLIYSCAICLMSWLAWTRDFLSRGYTMIWIGTLFFIASDMTIAIHRFTQVYFGSMTVMATYCLAQYLIVIGYLTYRHSQAR